MTPFRPVFTRRLAQRLRQGQVLNLVSRPGQGGQRLLADLQHLLSDAHYVDLSRSDLTRESALPPHAQQQGHTWPEAIRSWNEALSPPILLLDRVDQVGNRDVFDAAFFTQLSPIWISTRLGLLLATEQPLSTLPNTWPETEVIRLPPLGFKRIKEELFRHFPNTEAWLPLATDVFAHPRPYDLLQVLITHLQTNPVLLTTPTKEWMPTVIEEFNRTQELDIRPRVEEQSAWWLRVMQWMRLAVRRS